MEFHTTGPVEGAACMCEGVLGKKNFNSSNFEGLYLQAKKKRTKKVFLSIRENINNVFKLKKKKRGRSIYFRTRSAKEESADDILFNFCLKTMQKKKKYRGPYVFCEAILHARLSCHLIWQRCTSRIISSLFVETVLDYFASARR